jgi:hypothetical protein
MIVLHRWFEKRLWIIEADFLHYSHRRLQNRRAEAVVRELHPGQSSEAAVAHIRGMGVICVKVVLRERSQAAAQVSERK